MEGMGLKFNQPTLRFPTTQPTPFYPPKSLAICSPHDIIVVVKKVTHNPAVLAS